MRYDLLDLETGNLYGRFPTEEAALAFVLGLVAANGIDILETVALGGRDESGGVLPVTTGPSLVQRLASRDTHGIPTR